MRNSVKIETRVNKERKVRASCFEYFADFDIFDGRISEKIKLWIVEDKISAIFICWFCFTLCDFVFLLRRQMFQVHARDTNIQWIIP